MIIKDIYYNLDTSKPVKRRKTVRGIIVNEDNKVALLHIVCSDKFGKRNHYETPGGGVEINEDDLIAIKREIQEEIGYTIKDIKYIDNIAIEYNPINRIDESNFYYAKIANFVGSNLLEYEKEIFKEIKWVRISDIDKFYEDNKTNTVGDLIHKRDKLMIDKAREKGYFD